MQQPIDHRPWTLVFATWSEADVAAFLGYLAQEAQRQGGGPRRTGALVGRAVQDAIQQGPPSTLARDPRSWAAHLVLQAVRQAAVAAAEAQCETGPPPEDDGDPRTWSPERTTQALEDAQQALAEARRSAGPPIA